MYWTIFIIVSIAGRADPTYIAVDSFVSRKICEDQLTTRHLSVDGVYNFHFKCMKTDENVYEYP
jgi:hypothetical protein